MSENRKRFFKNGMLLTAVALAIRTVGIAFNSYITRSVGAEGIGLYTLIMTVYSFAVTLATSGINLTVTRLVASAIGDGDRARVKEIMRHALVYSLIFSVAAGVLLFFLAPYFAASVLGDTRTTIPLRVLSASLVPIAFSSLFSGYFVGVKRVARNATVQVLGQGLKIGITLLLVARLLPYGVEYATIALCLATTLTEVGAFLIGLIQFIIDRKRERCGAPRNKAGFSDITGMALPLALSAYVRSALLTLEHVLIPKRLRDRGESHENSLSEYGILHGMALPLLIFPMSPLSSFAGLLVPEFAEASAAGQTERMRRIASEALNVTLSYAALVTVLLYVFSEELGYVVYNSYGAGRYVAMLAPVVPIMYLDHVTDSILKGVGEHVFSMWVNIADSLLSVVLVWVLIPVMGIYGYAVVIVVMEAFNFILSAARLYKRIKFKIKLFRSLIIPLCAAFISAYFTKSLFIMGGEGATSLWLFLKLVFAASIFTAFYVIFAQIARKGKKSCGT